MLSELDINILEILQEDARTGVDKIAAMCGVSEEEAAKAIAEMENTGVILRYPAMINWDKVDRDSVEALIEVRVTPQRDQGFDVIAERIYRFDEVSSVYLMSGAYDLMVLVKGRTIKELALFVSEKLSTLEHVLSTATHFVLKKYKVDGVIISGATEDQRLKVTL